MLRSNRLGLRGFVWICTIIAIVAIMAAAVFSKHTSSRPNARARAIHLDSLALDTALARLQTLVTAQDGVIVDFHRALHETLDSLKECKNAKR